MEAPEPDEDATPEEGFIFVLEKATLETAKVGKVRRLACLHRASRPILTAPSLHRRGHRRRRRRRRQRRPRLSTRWACRRLTGVC
jgi:hypothetical protein